MTAQLGAITIVLGAALVAAPSAQADTTETQRHAIPGVEAQPADWDNMISVGQGRSACPVHYVCIWTGTNFTGSGRGYTGSIAHGDGVTWFNTVWQDHVYSAFNNTLTVPITFLNVRGSTGTPIGSLNPGTWVASGWVNSDKADGMYHP
ncbi:peptidase inhibitor family I36 protein [Streptomyces umbrinus]|uniref:peptidase inhibitor family I36 protein n=1 Tax=Streptomyces umbrinus TaxID=67370 RepID=UPI0033C1A6F4